MADEALGGGSGAGEDAADPATSGAKKHKRDDEAGDKSQEGGKAAAAESSDEEEICRFCFEGTEEGELIKKSEDVAKSFKAESAKMRVTNKVTF